MGFAFNPFTGNFDVKGAGGGGGSAFFAGEVATYADLPLDGTAALDSRWLVRSNSGTWPFSSYKQAGVYVRIATVGSSRDNDYRLTDTSFFDVMSDSAFLIYDDGDATKNLKFQLSGIPTASTVTLTAPAASGTIALTSDFAAPPAIGSTTRNTGAFTTLSLPLGSAVGSASAPALSIGAANTGIYISGNQLIFAQGGADRAYFDNSGRFFLAGAGGLAVGATGSGINFTRSVALVPDANGTLAQRSTTQAQTFQLYNTTDSGLANYERGFMRWSSNVLQIGTEKAGTGSARALAIQTDGTTRINIGTAGQLGFFGASAAAQPTAVADATDAATVITQLNALLSRMRTLGLIAT